MPSLVDDEMVALPSEDVVAVDNGGHHYHLQKEVPYDVVLNWPDSLPSS